MRPCVFIWLAPALAACPELNFPPPQRPRPDAGPATSPVLETRKTPECWRKDEPRGITRVNTCRYCHTAPFPGSGRDDTARQTQYPLEDNPFVNVTAGEREYEEQLAPTRAELEAIIATDNFLRTARRRGGGTGLVVGQVGRPAFGRGIDSLKYFPDLDYGDADFALVDRDGFVAEPAPGQTAGSAPAFAALDVDYCAQAGISPCDLHRLSPSGWRAVAWLPFAHASQWPRLSGSFHVAFVRLPEPFRKQGGQLSRATYIENFARLLRALRGDPAVPTAYVGDAASARVLPFRYPIGFEAVLLRFYVTPQSCAPPQYRCRAARVREVQVLAKSYPADEAEAHWVGGSRLDSRALGEGEAAVDWGLAENGAGWDYAAFIEASDAPDAPLRPQSPAELLQCAGCHGPGIGAALDSTFVLPRAVGWRPMDYRVREVANGRTGRPEVADALLTFFGATSAPGVDGAIEPGAFFGSTAQLVDAGKRARQIARSQDFVLGRDPILAEAAYHESPPTLESGEVAPPPHALEAYAPAWPDGGLP